MESLILPKACSLKPEIIQALSNVHKELNKQKLGLKLWYHYSPQAGALKKRPHKYKIDARSIDDKGNLQPLRIPAGYFSDSPKAGSDIDYWDTYQELLDYRAILFACMKQHGFDQIGNSWEYKDSRGIRLGLIEEQEILFGA
jgi:D-alanyl-D-alanine dipeptidase